jgi:hypothetical protein
MLSIVTKKLLPSTIPLIFLPSAHKPSSIESFRALLQQAKQSKFHTIPCMAIVVEGQGGSFYVAEEMRAMIEGVKRQGTPVFTFAGSYVTGVNCVVLATGDRKFASRTSVLGKATTSLTQITP